MGVTVVTGWHPEAYAEYAQNFVRTFEQFWPASIALVCYVEEWVKNLPRAEQRMLRDIDGVGEFIDSHQEPVYHGKEVLPIWSKKEHRVGYSWRHDAVKFSRQLFIPEHAAQFLEDGDYLVWFDADVVTFDQVPEGLIPKLMSDYSLITIGRDRGSTDIGFWAVRLSKHTRELLKSFADSYRTGYVFTLCEWHSGFVFDHWVRTFKAQGKITHRSLTQENGVYAAGHVWFDTAIGKYTDHLKGDRKKLGYSPERFRRRG